MSLQCGEYRVYEMDYLVLESKDEDKNQKLKDRLKQGYKLNQKVIDGHGVIPDSNNI
jgi:hypothetical protein